MIFLEKGWSLQHHTEPEQNMNTMVNVAESCFNGKMIALYRNLWGAGQNRHLRTSGVTTIFNEALFRGLSGLFVTQIEVENLHVFHEYLWLPLT